MLHFDKVLILLTLDTLYFCCNYRSDLPLSDPEKSVLSKGLNIVPIAKRTDEFAVKQDVEKFLRRIQLKAFFQNKEDTSRTSEKDIFDTINVWKSNWTPPEGQFTSVDFFVQKSRYDIQKLKFNHFTKCSNLSTEEWAALKNLNKRRDIIIKPADKGGAVVVWRSDLYQQEAFRQLSNKSFYASGQRPHPNQPKTCQKKYSRSNFKTRTIGHGSKSDFHNS